jgi:hypothetical protein
VTGPECWPSAEDCRKRHCYTCGRYDGVKHRGGTGPNGELLFSDVHRWWWNHNWITHWQDNNRGGSWVRNYPGGVGQLLATAIPDPTDRIGNNSRYLPAQERVA